MKTSIESRNSGIDALRLFSMFMVVGLHVLGQCGILYSIPSLTFKGELIWFFEISMYCAVNCFALISGFVGVHAKHKSTSLINICIQAVFYCAIFTLGYLIYSKVNNIPLDYEFVVYSMVPTVFGKYWYVSAYFCLFFFMPILNKVIEFPRSDLKKILIAITVICLLSRIYGSVSGLQNGYSFLWLAILYVFGGYIEKYRPFAKWSFKLNIIGFFVCAFVTLGSKIIIELVTTKMLGRAVMTNMLVAYTSPTVLLSTVFLFNIFLKIKIGNGTKKFLAFLAPASFGVYLIHCQPVVFDLLLKGSLAFLGEKPIYYILPAALFATIIIFTICILIDLIRIQLFKLLRVHMFARFIAKSIDKFVNVFTKGEVTDHT